MSFLPVLIAFEWFIRRVLRIACHLLCQDCSVQALFCSCVRRRSRKNSSKSHCYIWYKESECTFNTGWEKSVHDTHTNNRLCTGIRVIRKSTTKDMRAESCVSNTLCELLFIWSLFMLLSSLLVLFPVTRNRKDGRSSETQEACDESRTRSRPSIEQTECHERRWRSSKREAGTVNKKRRKKREGGKRVKSQELPPACLKYLFSRWLRSDFFFLFCPSHALWCLFHGQEQEEAWQQLQSKERDVGSMFSVLSNVQGIRFLRQTLVLVTQAWLLVTRECISLTPSFLTLLMRA